MNIDSKILKQDIDTFQGTVMKLSKEVQDTSSLWKDEKYYGLASSISEIAFKSKNVLVYGDKLCDSIDRFFELSEEEY